jgi:DNA polymerase I-like protein with 3'-5' exonuclease and polymerase domains
MIYFIGNNLFNYNNIENSTTEYCYNYLKDKKVIGLDIETSRKYIKGLYKENIYQPGLDPYVSKIVMLQIGDLENQFVIDTRVISPLFLKDILENNDILKIGHNLKFEGKHIFCNYKIVLNNVWDTMICERILYNGLELSNSLQSLMKRYFNVVSVNDIELFTENEKVEEEIDELDLIDYKETVYVDKSVRLQFINIEDTPFTEQQILYGIEDIINPIKIYNIQNQGVVITPDDLYFPKNGFLVENRVTQVLALMELRGLKVDVQGWLDLYEKNKKILTEKTRKLNDWIIKNHPKFGTWDLFDANGYCRIQWSSSKQVIEFAKYLKFCPKEMSKQTHKMEYSVGAKALFKLLTNENKDNFYSSKEIEFKDENDIQAFILNYLLLKKYEQLTTTFGIDWITKFVHPITGRIHSNHMQIMNTGRLSSTNPNQQQIPNGKEWRKLFIADKDCKLIACDFSAQEVRVLAEVSGVKDLQDFFNNGHPIYGEDFHSFTASKMFSIIRNQPDLVIDKKENKKERNISKGLTFTLAFGGGANKIASDLGIELEEAQKFESSYLDGFAGLRQNFEATKKEAYNKGWIQLDSFSGKRYFFKEYKEMLDYQKSAMEYYPNDYRTYSKEQKEKFKKDLYDYNPEVKQLWSKWAKLKGTLERRALNFRIQGNASFMSKIAMLLLHKLSNNLDYGLLLMAHDEAVLQFPIDIIEEKAKEVKELMIKSGTYTCKNVKLDAEYEIGDYWIH